MKSLINLLTALLADASSTCSVETARDLAYAKSRALHEGVSFYTITLPHFAEDFERCLDVGAVTSTDFAGWRKTGCLPRFLSGFTRLVFDAKGGLRNDASEDAVFHIRQITRFFKKMRIPCTDSRIKRAFDKYHDLEESLHEDDRHFSDPARLAHFGLVCRILWSNVFGSDEFFNPLDLVPRHGPGATAERVSGNAKYLSRNWHSRLDEEFPFSEYLFTSVNHLMHNDEKDNVILHDEHQEPPVRVVAVPKTLKSPRIIAIEPVCMQYTQQAVSSYLVGKIERSIFTKRSIRFTDQQPNKELALRASRTLSHATIDLSDASDRVEAYMVRIMLQSQPNLLRAVFACRSMSAQTPDGRISYLKKFASMGSALCFPIEAMYFYSVIVHSLLWEQGCLLPTPLDILRMSKGRYVYGDDIIVPTRETDSVIRGLELFGSKVNVAKSFSGVSFRESCGTDGFRGHDVTPVYLRELSPDHKRDTARLLSWVATSNQLHLKGCWKTADYMKHVVESVLGKLPVLHETSPGLGWLSFQGCPSAIAMCLHTHCELVRTYKVRTIKQRDILEGYPALLKYFLNAKGEPDLFRPSTQSKEHLLRSVRLCTVSRKRTWVPVH